MKIKANTIITILGVMIAILAGSLSLTVSILPLYLVKTQLFLIAGIFLTIMIIIVVRMLLNPNWLVKTATFPVIFALIMASLIIYYSGFYDFILAATGMVEYKDSANTDMVFKLMPILHVGIWVSLIPLFIGAFMTFRNVNKTLPRNLDKYLPASGRVISVEETDIYMNRSAVYKVTLEIRSAVSDIYEASRKLTISIDRVDLLVVGSEVRLLVHEDKKDDFLFDMGQGVVF
ncbi:hypothetical protein EZV73_18630 [Acidaminobacter sp. JC074]|uniref:hypothetical protein n=1 Tax=Acidaminobacter sp. JC074 TaxID=2530199 RepID=UPI001F0E4988|nr:hypothetical protein [Acidaminobacter sp. JC074]MCH4889605.1 hypothetical protein [Acidaminobacter sp. JC074]